MRARTLAVLEPFRRYSRVRIVAADDATGQDPSKSSAIASWAAIFPAVLGGVGVLLFGVLTLGYAAFYGRLGLTPETVGLTYANTLARSTGSTLVLFDPQTDEAVQVPAAEVVLRVHCAEVATPRR